MRRYLPVLFAIVSLGIVIGLFIGFQYAAQYYDYGAAERELPAAIAAYRAEGLPFDTADVAIRDVSESENVVPVLRRAFKLLPSEATLKRLDETIRTKQPGSPELISQFSPALNLAETAMGRKQAHFGLDWDLISSQPNTDVRPMGKLVAAAVLRAEHLAKSGLDSKALADLNLIRSLAAWAGMDPYLMPMMQQIRYEAQMFDAANRCLAAAQGSLQRIAFFKSWLQQGLPNLDLRSALRTEAFFQVSVCRNGDLTGELNALSDSEVETTAPKPDMLRREGLPPDRNQRAYLTRCLQKWTRLSHTTRGFTVPVKEISQAFEAEDKKIDSEHGLSWLIAGASITGSYLEQTFLMRETLRNLQLAFGEALLTRRISGQWPSHVNQLDPFTGQPLKVISAKGQLRIYSVGKDRQDNGGLTRQEGSDLDLQGEDVVVAFPRITLK